MSAIPCPACGDMQGGCTYCTPDDAQSDPMTVTGRLRWDGNDLMLGVVLVGNVNLWPGGGFIATPERGRGTSVHTTEAAARAALVQAVKEAIGG